MKSIGSQIKQLAGLLGTSDISEWEQGFITNILEQTNDGELTVHLTGKQVNRIEEIYQKHFSA